MIDRLFVPFDRLDTQDGPGTGLGMVLAKGLATAMNGSLSVDSTLGEGTTVQVLLPA
jgi:signal transduction histidine kinase